MTIETVTNKTIQSGNGSNKDFDFAFEILDEDSLSLTKRGSDGTETAITTNFTVTGIGDEAGGTVNYPTSGSALAANEKIIIKRVVALKQPENLRNQGDYSLEDIEDALDRAVMLCQQLQEQIDRSLKLPLTSSSTYVTVDDFVANKLLYVSSDGTKVKMSDADFGSIQTYLTALAAIAADISAVAAIDTEVTTVAGIDSEVVSVAAIAANVTTVAAIDTEVAAVAALATEIAAVAALATEIAAVYANLSDIQNAASFNFPTLGGSDAGKFLKVNAGNDGYDLVSSVNMTAFSALTGAANKIPYFTALATMDLLTIATSAELVTGADTSKIPPVSAILAAMGFSSYFQSSQQTITLGGGLTLAHGLPRTPILYKAFLICTDAGGEHGYTQNQETPMLDSDLNTGGGGSTISMVPDGANVVCRYGSAAIYVLNKSTGAYAAITTSKWRCIIRAWA